MTAREFALFMSVLRAEWGAQKVPRQSISELEEAYAPYSAIDFEQAKQAITRLVLSGREWPPGLSVLRAEMLKDPSAPTWDEAVSLIFGARGCLAARAPSRTDAGTIIYASERERGAARETAILQRASDMHPLVGRFVARHGVSRLLRLNVDDPQWGEKNLRELGEDWATHVQSFEGRQVAAIAAGTSGRGELRRLDPLAVLDVGVVVQLPERSEGVA